MMFRIKCNGCGHMLPFSAAESGKPAACGTCGHHFLLPEVVVKPQAAPPAQTTPAKSRRWPLLILIPLLMAASAAAMWLVQRNTGRAANERYWAERAPRIIALKGEAERLAIAGKLDEAHARYRELEQLVAAKSIHDSSLWDLAERAKQDQDRVYELLLQQQKRENGTTESVSLPLRPYPASMALAQIETPATQAIASTQTSLARTQALIPPATLPATTGQGVLTPTTRTTVSGGGPGPRIDALPPATRPIVQAAALPTTRPLAPRIDGVTDAQIRAAMQRAVDWMVPQFVGDQIRVAKLPRNAYLEGLNALCVYALLEAGRVLPDERLRPTHAFTKGIIDQMKDRLMMPDADATAPVTYAKALRVAALAVHRRPQDWATLEADTLWLMRTSRDGAYTYHDQVSRFGLQRGFYIEPGQDVTWLHNGEPRVPTPPRPRPPGAAMQHFRLKSAPDSTTPPRSPWSYQRETFDPPDLPWDNSNGQFALFGVWSAAEAGAVIPFEYWLAAEEHWLRCQLPTGLWNYDGKQPGYWAMTLAGINSLLATYDYVGAYEVGGAVGQEPYAVALQRSLAWLNQNGLAINSPPVHYLGYNLFGLMRFGMHAGQKYLAGRDWYRELSFKILSDQLPNGAWGRAQDGPDALIDTAFILLFLARGQQPVMMNKLMFDGYWNNRGRDAANLARVSGDAFERPLRWQVVPVNRDWTDWTDSPVLFLASHQTPKLAEADYARLRGFIDAGGMLVTHADNGATNFNSFAGTLARRLFPGQTLIPLPRDHSIWSLQYKLTPSQFDLKAISNGSRVQMLHIAGDVGTAWHLRDANRRPAFELGVNLFAYAAGKPDLRTSVSLAIPPDMPDEARHTIAVARIRYDGAWDPEPFAWKRFARQFKINTTWGLSVAAVQAADLSPSSTPFAHLTGAAPASFTDAQVAAIKAYVESGGVLLIDACGGSPAFGDSAVAMLAKAFPEHRLQVLAPDHPVMRAAGPPHLRPSAEMRLAGQAQPLLTMSPGKGAVLLSRLDLTSGLLNAPAWEILGYSPGYAQGLVQETLLWTARRGRP